MYIVQHLYEKQETAIAFVKVLSITKLFLIKFYNIIEIYSKKKVLNLSILMYYIINIFKFDNSSPNKIEDSRLQINNHNQIQNVTWNPYDSVHENYLEIGEQKLIKQVF